MSTENTPKPTGIRLGFTGTQRGMTPEQKHSFESLIGEQMPIEFHHGDCIGADSDAHDIVETLDESLIIIHPPSNDSKRAYKQGRNPLNYTHPAKPYLDRNKDIVEATDSLIACPGEGSEQLRSGTWSTVRYARKLRRPIYVILPDGRIV